MWHLVAERNILSAINKMRIRVQDATQESGGPIQGWIKA
jgi:hypothetical protein